jgi:exo-1,4-beta-D-glucosaminidase
MNIRKIESLLILLATTRAQAGELISKPCFFARGWMRVTSGAGGPEMLPVIWQDNCISLLPGERRAIAASYRTSALGTAKPPVEISGWNLQ